MTTADAWHDDVVTMQADDAALQRVYQGVRAELGATARERTRGVHVYPSPRCTYTIGKNRIFVRMRGEDGAPLPDCALRHVILHELAHTLNPTVGHDRGFLNWFAWIRRGIASCPEEVPVNYNPCTDG